MICKPDGTYEIEQSDIDKVNKWVYKLLSTRATSGTRTFDLNAFVKYVYNTSLEKTQDAQKALVIARQVPISIDISISADDTLRKGLSALQGYSTDAVKDLKSSFLESMTAVSDLVNTDASKGNLANTLAATADTDLIQPKSGPVINATLVSARDIVSDLPYTPLSTTGNENIPGREWYYGFIKNLSNADLGLSTAGTASYFGVADGIRISMVRGSEIPVDQLYLDLQNQPNIEDIKKDQVFTVVTNNTGDFVYFDDNYNVTDAENGKLVYFPIRTIPSMKVVDGRKVFNITEQSDRTVQSINDRVRRAVKDNTSLKEEEVRDDIEREYQGAYTLLSDATDYLKANPSEKILMNLTGLNKGTLNYDQDAVTTLSSIKNLGFLDITIPAIGITSEEGKQEVLRRRYITIDGVSDKIPFSMNEFSMASAIKVADLLVNDVYTTDGLRLSTADKYKIIGTFVTLGSGGLTIVAKDNEIRLGNVALDLTNKEVAKAALIDHLTRTLTIKNSEGQDVEVKNQYFFDDFTYRRSNGIINDFSISPASDGVYVITNNIVDYKEWIKNNAYTKVLLNANGELTQVNGYFEFAASPATRQAIASRKVEQVSLSRKGTVISLDDLSTPTIDNVEEALSEIKNRAKGRGNKPLFSMRHSSLAANKAQVKRGKKWFDKTDVTFTDAEGKLVTKKLSELMPYEEMFKVMNSGGNIRATWTRNGITLFNGSDYTDLYHEAWHGFTQLFLNKEQKTALYNEVKSLKEDIKYYDHKAGAWKTMNSGDLDFSNRNHIIYAEEYLAEKFRTYSIDKKAPSAKVKSIFRKIWDAIKAFFGRTTKESAANPYDNSLMSKAFDQLYTGNLVDYTFDQANVQFGTLNYGITATEDSDSDIPGLNITDSNAISEAINTYISDYIKLAASGEAYGDKNPAYSSLILTDAEYKQDALIYAKGRLQNRYKELSEEYAEAPSLQKPAIEKQLKTLEFAIAEFGDIDNLLGNKKGTLAYFNKKTGYLDLTTQKTDDNTDDPTEETDEDDTTGQKKALDRSGLYAGNGTEVTALEKMDSVSKFIFGNIIERVAKTTENPDGLKLNKLGIPKTAEPSVMLNIATSLTENLNDRDEMYKALWKGSEEKQNGEYTPKALMLRELLTKIGEPSKADSLIAQMLWNKIYNNLRTDRLISLQVNVNLTDKGFNVITGETDSSDKALEKGIADAFVFNNPSDFMVTDPSTNERYLDVKAFLNSLKDENGKIEIAKINPSKFFKGLGITITESQESFKAIREQKIINDLLSYRLPYLVKVPGLKIQGLKELIYDEYSYTDNGREFQAKGQAGVFKKLLRIEGKANPKFASYMRLFGGEARSERSDPSGPGNTIIALNSSTNFFTDVISKPELSQYNPKKNPAVKTSILFNKMYDLRTGARNKTYKIEHQSMLGTQLMDKRGEIEELISSLASSESNEQVAYLRDFFSYNLHGAGEAYKHADKNMAYITQLVGNSRYYIPPSLFAQGAGITNKGRQEANRIITGYIGSELERIKKVIASNNGEITSGEKASDIILYTSAPVKKDGLITEMKYVTLADVGAEFTVYDDILTTSIKDELINNKDIQTVEDFQRVLSQNPALEKRIHTDLNNYFAKVVKEDRDQLESFNFLKGAENRNQALSTINARLFDDLRLNEDQVFDASLLHFVYASFIHKTEMNTLVYGDPVTLTPEDHMKRIPGFYATGRIPVSDTSMEEKLQKSPGEYYESEFFKKSGLTKPSDNQLIRKTINTAVLEDAIESISAVVFEQMVTSYMKRTKSSREVAEFKYRNYRNMKSADGQAWISFDAYRALELRLDNWSPSKEMLYQQVLRGEETDVEKLESFFPIKKMQYSGPVGTDNFAVNAFHKYSVMPLIPTIIKNTELELLHNKMVSQNIAYTVMHSGSKNTNLGKDGKLNKFYTEPNGNHTLAFAAADYKFITNPIFLHYFKEQLVTHDAAKGSVKFPTQKRALITSGLFEFGIPSDFQVGVDKTDDERLAAWNALPNEKARLKASQAYTLTRNYQSALNDIFKTAATKLKMELGYKDPNSTKNTEGLNLEKLMSFIEEQLINRETLSEYELDFLELSPSGQLVYPQDFGSDPAQIEKLIAGLVNKKITDQISRGESFIQASSVGFRKTNLRIDPDLLFYRIGPDGNTLPMQVKIPLIGDFKNLLNHVDNDGKKIGTITRLNQLIKDEVWMNKNREMLTMGGDRIPIQGHNSMEVMEVAEFLDPSGGNMMVLPLEIVAKTGGDFDIDKLICLIPVIKNNMGLVELSKPVKTRKLLKTIVKEKEVLQNQLDEVRKIKIKLSDEDRAKIEGYKEEQSLAQESFNQNYINDYYVGGSLDKYLNRLDGAQKAINSVYENAYSGKNSEIESIQNKLRELNRQQDSYRPDTYQNALMAAMDAILLRGDNFSNLTLPNDTDTFTEGSKGSPSIVDEFTKVNRPYDKTLHKTESKREKMSHTRIMENRHNNNKAFAMAVGKSGVSMGAKTNKQFATFKEVGMHMEPSYTIIKNNKSVTIEQRLLLDSNTLEVNDRTVISLGHANDVDGRDISDQISQLMNGDLDVAKNDWVFDINAVAELKPEYLFLIESGTGPEMATAFTSQPLIKKYVDVIRTKSNAFSQAVDKKGKALNLAKYDALLDVLNEYLPDIFSYEKAPINEKTGEIINPSRVSLIRAAQVYLAGQEKFKLSELRSNAKKGMDGEITEYDKKVFAHFLELTELTKGDGELKRSIDIDTKKQLTAIDALKKIRAIQNLSNKFPKDKIMQILNDTYLDNFKTQDLMLEIIATVLPLRGSSVVLNYLEELGRSKNFDDQKTRESFEKNWIGDLPAYIAANAKPRVTGKDKTYRGIELGDVVDIKNQTILPYGAAYINGDLLADQVQLDFDFDNQVYSKKGYGGGQLAKFPALVFQEYSKDKKTARNLYRAFVYEREIARSNYPYATIEENADFIIYKRMRLDTVSGKNLGLVDLYEEFIRNKGLYNSGLAAGKFESMPEAGMFSMYDYLDAILKAAGRQGTNLKEKYSVLDALIKVPIANKSFIALKRKVKDVNLKSDFTAQILELMDPTEKKVSNDDFNMAISSFFAKFPEMAFAQAGNNSANGLYIGSIIDPKAVATAQADNLNEFLKAIKNPATAKAMMDDYTKKYEEKAPYKRKSTYFNYNSNKDITDYATEAPIAEQASTEMTPSTLSITRSEIKKDPHWKKDEAMANASTKAIAKATTPKTSTYKSSTKAYLAAIGGASTEFTSSDSVWVFGAGAWSATAENIKEDFYNYYLPTIDKAIESGVTTFNVGTASGIDTLATEYLKDKGFNVESQGQWNQLTTQPSTSVETARTIYDKLGNKTQSENVEIAGIGNLSDVQYDSKTFWSEVVPEAKAQFGDQIIVAYRGNRKKSFLDNYKNSATGVTIGNPFDWQVETGTRNEQGIKSTKRFIHWMITGDNMGVKEATEEYRQAIINDIKNGKLKNRAVIYYQEKGYATHATAIDYLINKYDWNDQTVAGTEPKGKKVADGIYVNQDGLTPTEELELFNIIKPVLEQQSVKSNSGKSAPKMAGLSLNWDYTNGPTKRRDNGYTRVEVGETLKSNTTYGWFSSSVNGQKLYPITKRLVELMSKATGIDVTNYDGAIINIYNEFSFIGNHPDIDESITAKNYPVVVVNIGGPGNITLGTDKQAIPSVNLKSGAGYIFGFQGENRTIPHSTYASSINGTLPAITTQMDGETLPAGSYRISVTMRRVMPLEAGMPSEPAITTRKQVTTQGPGSETKMNIYAGTGENAELSNFANRPFTLGDGTTYPSVEHAYQLEKLQYSNAYTDNEIDAIVEDINKKSAAQAKAFGRTVKGLDNQRWNEDSSANMKILIKSSFEQNPDALAKLLATGNATLTHTQDKGKWGTEFPKLLMEVRNELNPSQPQAAVKPAAQGTPGLIIGVRGPEQLVDYETGNLIPVAKVYKQTQFIKRDDKGVETGYELLEDRAVEIMNQNPDNLFVFDWFRPHTTGKENPLQRNNTRQAWRKGLATGQSFGITTRTFNEVTPTDEQFERVKEVIDEQIQQLVQLRDSGKIITFPSDGIGQNFKAAGADQIFVYLSKQLLENFGYRNPVFDTMVLADESLGLTGLDYIQDFYKKMADAETGEPAQTITDSEVREHIKTCKLK
jgi:predicted NAD-dependent protein-ADP-ribosyltransferase YbiA (DUF1768 family)